VTRWCQNRANTWLRAGRLGDRRLPKASDANCWKLLGGLPMTLSMSAVTALVCGARPACTLAYKSARVSMCQPGKFAGGECAPKGRHIGRNKPDLFTGRLAEDRADSFPANCLRSSQRKGLVIEISAGRHYRDVGNIPDIRPPRRTTAASEFRRANQDEADPSNTHQPKQ
jgi:hypothetical protein